MKTLLTTAAAFALVCGAQVACAQDSQRAQDFQQGQSSTSPIQQRVRSNLVKAGFTNVQIMPSSFQVRATDPDGNPVMTAINPDL